MRVGLFQVFVATTVLAAVAAGAPASAPAKYAHAVIRGTPAPGIRFTSGLAICDEILENGRWVNRYWMSTGQIIPERQLTRRAVTERSSPDAFELAMEGHDLAGTWKWVGARQSESHGPEGLLVTLELESTARPINIRVQTLLSGGPVIVRWLEITNNGRQPAAITKVSPWSGQLWAMGNYMERLTDENDAAFEVGHTEYQDKLKEGAWVFEPVLNATKTFMGTCGQSGWGHPTFFARNRATGEWFVGSLGWSGNWAIQLDGRQDAIRNAASLTFRMGPIAADPALRVLAPGETVKSPEAHLLCTRGDLDHVIQVLHEHVRANVLPPPIRGREYQVEANHRGYIAGHEDEAGLKREIDIAADVGAEMFVIDAGWYGPEPNRWHQNVGDWYAGAWLPNDVNPVREYARKKGMLFGLWVEIESIGAASRLRKEHPDWVMTRDGKPVANGRRLDVANPAVAAWMESEIARIIKKYDLDMFRIDYNTAVGAGGNQMKDGFLENTVWRHVEALYGMFDRLRKQFPTVIFQNCASGGGRLDFGIMRRFHNTEASDMLRGPRSLKIFNGITWLLPPEILLRTIGTETSGLAADGDLDFQVRQLLMGRPIFRGIAPTLEEFNPLLRSNIRESVERFKKTIRPIMLGSRVYHHTPLTPLMRGTPWVVLEYATPDARRMVGWFFRTAQNGDPVFIFIPRGLNRTNTYRVTLGNTGETIEIPGDRLLLQGIPVRLEENQSSEIMIFETK